MCGCECCQSGDPTCFDPSQVDTWASSRAWVCGCACPNCISRVIVGAFGEGRKLGVLVGREEQLTRDDRRSMAMLYGYHAGQEEEIMHVKAVIAEHYKVAPKAAEPLLRELGYQEEEA
jgi:hypothetical protein